MMEHRNALLVDIELSEANGYAERDTALEMLARLPATKRRRTVAGDKAYDTEDFVADVRELGITPHLAPNTTRQRSTIDGRTTRHRGTSDESTDPETDRGTLRLDQDHRRRPQTPLHRPATQPSLVPHDRRRLQHPQNHRPRRHTSLNRRPKHGFANHPNPQRRPDQTPPTARPTSRADFQHPARRRGHTVNHNLRGRCRQRALARATASRQPHCAWWVLRFKIALG